MKSKYLAMLAAVGLWTGQAWAEESMAIKAAAYNADEKVLTITFGDDSQYQYAEVRDTTYKELLNSESQGEYFNKNIRGKYKTTKISD
jgi:lysyl-tRNA synthetase class 2